MLFVFTLLFDQHPNITHPILVFMSCITMIIGAFGVIAFKDIKENCSISSYFINWFYYFRLRIKFLLEFMVLFLSNKRYCSKTLLFFIIGSLVYMSGYREYKYLYGLARESLSLA